MNLKESFRYQNFLEGLMVAACDSLTNREHTMTVTKTHLRNKANPEANDVVEQVDFGKFYKNDDVLDFMLKLVEEKYNLTIAIGAAKASVGYDIDAAVETNKFRQSVASRVKAMLRNTPSKKIERGTDYKFNVEGNQTQYFYDIEVVTTEAFDRLNAKDAFKKLISEADEVSAQIDFIMVNTVVHYEPPFNVNDSFEDAMDEFLSKR